MTNDSRPAFGDLVPGARILLGPGPTMADPRVLRAIRAMATPLLGQFDPEFTAIRTERGSGQRSRTVSSREARV